MRRILLSDLTILGTTPRDQGQLGFRRVWAAHGAGPVLLKYEGTVLIEASLFRWSRQASAALEPWNGNLSAVVGRPRRVQIVPGE